jgi:parvulin-like peptidyl-prolyl isomerase
VLPKVISQAIKEKRLDLRDNIREKMGNLTNELNISFLHMKFHEQILYADDQYKDLRESYEYQKKIVKGYPLSKRFGRLTQLHQKIHHKIEKDVKRVSEDYIRNLRKEAAITKHYDVLKIKVTEEELKDFYQSHKEGLHGDEYRIPEKARIMEIMVNIDRESGNEDCQSCLEEKEREAREKAESAYIELGSGAEFRSVAQKYAGDTDDPIKSRWFARGSHEKVFDETIFSLDVGEISPVFKDGESFHIVKVLERKAGRFKAFDEIVEEIEREYRWQKGEEYLKENGDRILFTINAQPYTIGDFMKEYMRETPEHECHHMGNMDKGLQAGEPPQLCDLAHNDLEEQIRLVDRMIDQELIVEDTYSQMLHVEHQKEIEFLTMASLYPIFHQEEMENLIQVSDKMVEDYYQKNKDAYTYPAKAKISMIVTKGGEKEEEKKRALERAKKAYEELKPSFFSFRKGRDFAEVAGKYSEDKATSSRGGRLDLDVYECRDAVEYMLLHGFHQKIFHLKPGDISEIFEHGGNYYIVQINDMESRKQFVFEDVKELVREKLMEKEHQGVMENWEDDLLRSAGFTVYDQNIRSELIQKESPEKIGS